MRNARPRAVHAGESRSIARRAAPRQADDCTPRSSRSSGRGSKLYRELRTRSVRPEDAERARRHERGGREAAVPRHRARGGPSRSRPPRAKCARVASRPRTREAAAALTQATASPGAAPAVAVTAAQTAARPGWAARDPLLRVHATCARSSPASALHPLTRPLPRTRSDRTAAVASHPPTRTAPTRKAELDSLQVAHAAHNRSSGAARRRRALPGLRPAGVAASRSARRRPAVPRPSSRWSGRRKARHRGAKPRPRPPQSVAAELEARAKSTRRRFGAAHRDLAGVEKASAAHTRHATEAVTKTRATEATARSQSDARKAVSTADRALPAHGRGLPVPAGRARRGAGRAAGGARGSWRGTGRCSWSGPRPRPRRMPTAADARAKALRTTRDELGGLVERARELEVAVRARASRRMIFAEAVMQAEHEAKADLTHVQQGIKERASEAGIATSGADMPMSPHRPGGLLDPRNFERWLVAEALELLVEGASVRLMELSAGQYSFRLRGDEPRLPGRRPSQRQRAAVGAHALRRRDVPGLAGLARAGRPARRPGPRTVPPGWSRSSSTRDFGALDPDTLETVAGTIEALGTSARDSNGTPGGRPAGRMVGIVTHVPALAERVPVRYRVSRTDTSAPVEREDV